MIDKKDVDSIAKLAKLQFSDQETELLAKQMSQIVTYFNELQSVNTEGLGELSVPTPMDELRRVDQAVTNRAVERIIEQAPNSDGKLFKVPPVV